MKPDSYKPTPKQLVHQDSFHTALAGVGGTGLGSTKSNWQTLIKKTDEEKLGVIETKDNAHGYIHVFNQQGLCLLPFRGAT